MHDWLQLPPTDAQSELKIVDFGSGFGDHGDGGRKYQHLWAAVAPREMGLGPRSKNQS